MRMPAVLITKYLYSHYTAIGLLFSSLHTTLAKSKNTAQARHVFTLTLHSPKITGRVKAESLQTKALPFVKRRARCPRLWSKRHDTLAILLHYTYAKRPSRNKIAKWSLPL